MSALSATTVTLTDPVGHVVTNWGPDVAALIFRYGEVILLVERPSKTANIVTFESHVHHTLTIRAKGQTLRKLDLSKLQPIAALSTAGVVYVAGKDF